MKNTRSKCLLTTAEKCAYFLKLKNEKMTHLFWQYIHANKWMNFNMPSKQSNHQLKDFLINIILKNLNFNLKWLLLLLFSFSFDFFFLHLITLRIRLLKNSNSPVLSQRCRKKQNKLLFNNLLSMEQLNYFFLKSFISLKIRSRINAFFLDFSLCNCKHLILHRGR